MRNILPLSFAFLAAVLMSSCSPSAYILNLESRGPSTSGIDLSGKSLAVVYLESQDGSDSMFNNRVSDALAYSIEEDLFEGKEAVKVYSLPKDPNGKYSSKDTLSQYVMLLDADVVMLLDTPSMSEKNTRKLTPVNSKLYVYDSMADDDVTTLDSHTSVTSLADSTKALNIGKSLASPLKSKWVKEDFTFIYFEDFEGKWTKAVSLADDFKWTDAMEIWMELAKHHNTAKAACAKFNIAQTCYILEQYDLALEWLDSSEDSYPLSITPGLRTRITKKMSANK